MSILSRAVNVDTNPTRLDSTTDGDDGTVGSSVAVFNNGAVTIFIGGPNVTTATGAPVAAGTWSPGIDLNALDDLFGIVAAGTAEARVLEVGV